jgi:hypothetical protein
VGTWRALSAVAKQPGHEAVYFHEMMRLRMHGIKLPPFLTAWAQLYTCTRLSSTAISSIDSEMYSKDYVTHSSYLINIYCPHAPGLVQPFKVAMG